MRRLKNSSQTFRILLKLLAAGWRAFTFARLPDEMAKLNRLSNLARLSKETLPDPPEPPVATQESLCVDVYYSHMTTASSLSIGAVTTP
jgi:hypothetical protein